MAAFAAGAGASPGRLNLLILMVVCAVFITLIVHACLGLWECHQQGVLRGKDAAQLAFRALVLMSMFLVVILT